MSDPMKNAIEVVELVKQFRRVHQGGSIKRAMIRGIGRRPQIEHFTALKKISFTVPHGQTIAVIGSNGSGKSTLLGTLARVYRPTSGTIGLFSRKFDIVRSHPNATASETDMPPLLEPLPARVAPLLALGAGFHPDLSGLDNIRFYGAILGLSPEEIQAKRDSIIAFAELEDKADTALHTWNDGAKLRLGFAIAVHTDPDILLVDEVLAVGDEAFQNKCFRLIAQLQAQGKTILFVSHDLSVVERVAGRLLWLNQGVIEMDGDPATVLAAYRKASQS